MLNFDSANIYSSGVLDKKTVVKFSDVLKKHIQSLRNRGQGFYNLPYANIDAIKKYVDARKSMYKHIVILGIGGSALGAITLKDCFTRPGQSPHIYVLDNIDPSMIEDVENSITLSGTLFIVISKSGGTPETVAQYHYFKQRVLEKNLELKDHFIFITDAKVGFLRNESIEKNIDAFDVPANVGGRFSILSNVGLIPALFMGIDVDELLKGGRSAVESMFSENFETNFAYQLAVTQHELSKKNISITVLMPYIQKLKTFSHWYSQLLAESIGKTSEIGLTPMAALGATDQHSLVQLFMEGPTDKLILFIESKSFDSQLTIPTIENPEHHFLSEVKFHTLLLTEKKGTENALTENHKPNATISIEKIDAYHMGNLVVFFEASVAFLGELFEIDAYNQPGVEKGKQLTKQYLS